MEEWRNAFAVLLSTFLAVLTCIAQQPDEGAPRLVESGQVIVDGQTVPYRIHRLPVNSFPDLPDSVAGQLNERQCFIPQTYEARHPENVVHASLERAGSSDWAVLCSAQGTVSLLVFFGSSPGSPTVLSTAPETDRLQRHDSTGVLGFNWAIDPASPETVHQAQSAMQRKPARLDHDALADSVLDHRTIYHFYVKHAWKEVDTQD